MTLAKCLLIVTDHWKSVVQCPQRERCEFIEGHPGILGGVVIIWEHWEHFVFLIGVIYVGDATLMHVSFLLCITSMCLKPNARLTFSCA